MAVSYALQVNDDGTLRTLTLQDLIDVFTEALGDVDIKLGDIDLNTDTLEALATALGTYVDGLEAAQTTANATAVQVRDFLDTVETKLQSIITALAGSLLVDTSLVTAATYFSTSDARNGLMQTYTEQRASDSKTRTITITRSTSTGSISTQSASAWA